MKILTACANFWNKFNVTQNSKKDDGKIGLSNYTG